MKIPTTTTLVVLGFAASRLLVAAQELVHVLPLFRPQFSNGEQVLTAIVSIASQDMTLQVMNGATQTWVNPDCTTAGGVSTDCGIARYTPPTASEPDDAIPSLTGTQSYMVRGNASFGVRLGRVSVGCKTRSLSHHLTYFILFP
jgi:hypothetical protein